MLLSQIKGGDIVGRRYGRLVVVQVADRGLWSGKNRHYLCACDCGVTKCVNRSDLTSGGTRSCGCYRAEKNRQRLATHGRSDHPLYSTWIAMINRCYNPNMRNYRHYGGRGIGVCDSWRTDFQAFLADMGDRPSGRHSLDRIDNDLGYSRDNCRWATGSQQASNRRFPALPSAPRGSGNVADPRKCTRYRRDIDMREFELAIEAEIQAKGLNAPRLSPDKIDAVIVGEDYHVFPGTTLTVCCLKLRNGFTVVGESAAVSPENFDEELGRKIARNNARDRVWALEGYALRERLAACC